METRQVLVVLTVVVGLVLAACTPTSPAQGAPTDAPTSPAQGAPTDAPTSPAKNTPTDAPNVPLNDTGWLLENLNGQTVTPDTQITLNLGNGTLNGADGCNQYSGSYTADGERITVNKNIATTMMACAEPIMQQASAYINALTQGATYKTTGQQLTLLDAGGTVLATFTQLGKDPENATYLIEGEAITLVNGIAEKELAPGSASKQVTRYFGNAVEIDLDSDGLMDTAFLLVQDSGGSGTFYYVVAALKTAGGYLGTNAILLGDRIAPQLTFIDPDNPSQFVVSYGDRLADEPMSSRPSQMVSRTFKIEDGLLVEVVTSPTQTP